MSITIDTSGLDKLIKNARELDGTHEVRMTDLMPPAFIASHSEYPDLDSLFAASGFKIESADDFAAIPDDEWDKFIAENTDFESWAQMQQVAGAEFVKARLNRGI